MIRVLAAGLAIAGALMACGGGETGGNAAPGAAPGATDGFARPDSSGGAPAKPGTSSAPPALPPEATVRPTDFPLSNFVKAGVPEEEAWGDACHVPRPGLPCRVPFEGVAYLAGADRGQVALLAFENDSTTPATARVLPAEEGTNRLCFERGCPHGGAWLPYVPGAAAKSVTFVVELRATDGRVLARSFPRTFPIH